MRLFDASTVVDRWKEFYLNERTGIWRYPRLGAIFPAIVAANGDKSKIDAAIGNTSWTTFTCEECGTDNLTVGIEFDNVRTRDNSTVVICLECLQEAVQLASTVTLNAPERNNHEEKGICNEN